MSYNVTLTGTGGRYGYGTEHTAAADDSLYLGLHASGTYRSILNMQQMNVGRKVSVKKATLQVYARGFYASSVRTPIILSIGTTGGWAASSGGTLVATETVKNKQALTELTFNDEGLKLLAEYIANGTQFYLYFRGGANDQGKTQGSILYGYDPDRDYKAYVPKLNIEYNYSILNYGMDGAWKECLAHYGASDGTWKECEAYFGADGVWKEL